LIKEAGMNLTRTHEILTTKVSLVKVHSGGKKSRQPIVGYEYEPPTLGSPYTVYLGQGSAFKTSRVWEVEAVNDAFMIKTANSIYRLDYLERKEL
jgi:hypothetical protein